MTAYIVALIMNLSPNPSTKPPGYPFPPANPCSNPIKCPKSFPATPARPAPAGNRHR